MIKGEAPCTSNQERQVPMASIDPGVQIGDFQIIRVLGAGGMGIVYLAKQISLDRLVALKLLGNALTDPSDITRFHREAQAIAKLNNSGIASVYYVGQDRSVCYLAVEYVVFLLNQARARQWLNFATRLRTEHLHEATTR